MRSACADGEACATPCGAFNGTEPELLDDDRNRFVRVTFERGHAVHDTAESRGPATACCDEDLR